MDGGILPRQNRRVRRRGQRHRRLHLVEADAARRERVERRRGTRGGAVHADMIRAKRVDRDEQEVGMRTRRRPQHPPRRCGSHRDQAGRDGEPERRAPRRSFQGRLRRGPWPFLFGHELRFYLQ